MVTHEAKALIVITEVKRSQLSRICSVAWEKQLPLTHGHIQHGPARLPWERLWVRTEVTHLSKNKPGSCENKAWEP